MICMISAARYCTMGHRILKSLCWKTKGLKYGGRDYENRSDRAAGGRGKAFP